MQPIHRRWALVALITLLMSFSTACTRIQPGYGGIVVDLNGDDKGVDDIAVKTGRFWYNPLGKEVHELPFVTQREVWTASPTEGSRNNQEITFNSVEGTVIRSDVGFAWNIKRDRIPHVFVKLRAEVENIGDGYLRSLVRGEIGKCSEKLALDLIYGAQKSAVADCALTNMRDNPFVAANFDIDYLTWVGAFRFPDSVTKSINDKISAENLKKAAIEKAQGQAQAKRELAEADRDAMFLAAEGNDRLRKSLTGQILQFKTLEIMSQKWDGAYPKVMAGESGNLLLSLAVDDNEKG